jgi:hypothetical protein
MNKNQLVLMTIILLHAIVLNGQNSYLLVGDAYNHNIHQLDLQQEDLGTKSHTSEYKYQYSSFGLLDSANNLVYHTNGCYFFDADFNKINTNSIHHGSNIEKYCEKYGSISNDNALILPSLSDKNKIVLLHTKAKSNQITNTIQKTDLSFSTFNKDANEIIKEEVIYSGNISSVNHMIKKDGSGYWILFCDLDKKLILLFNLTSDEINRYKEIPFPIDSDLCLYDVNIKFSALGSKIGMHHSSCYFSLYDFDNCTGNIVGPRINLSAGDSDVFGIDFAFSQDDKYVILGQEKTKINSTNDILIFETSSIGVKINPKTSFRAPYNFSLGKIFTTDTKIVIFNRFEDYYFLDFRLKNKDITLDTIYFRRLPFRYTPSFSKLIHRNNIVTNDCITSTGDQAIKHVFTLYPNPAKNHLNISHVNVLNRQNLILKIIDTSGKYISTFLHQPGESIDVSHLAEGTYFILVSDTDYIMKPLQTLKFIKQ